MKLSTKRANQKGFTLVELAIVLVIIGLIVGGVLAGQDLIKAAKLQKGIKQITDTNTGATTFFGKYGSNPGDYPGAANFTYAVAGITANPGNGNGDGTIDGAASGTAAYNSALSVTGEVAAFYSELSSAGYVSDKISGIDIATAANNGPSSTVAKQTAAMLTFAGNAPGATAYLAVQSMNGANYINVVGTPSGAAASGAVKYGAGLTPAQAQSIDSKQDDGSPITGSIVSTVNNTTSTGATVPGTAGNATADVGTGKCVAATGATTYNGGVTSAQCTVSIKASF